MIGELELVALRAAEELDARHALCGSDLDRVQGVDQARREPSEGRVERDPVDIHPALEHEVVVEGDGPAVDLQGHDPRNVERHERPDDRVMEIPAHRRGEPGAVGSTVPAERMQREGVFERALELVRRSGDLDLEVTGLGELSAPAPVVATPLRGHLRPIDLVPAAAEVEHGRFGALDQRETGRTERGDEPAACGEPGELGKVLACRGDALGKRHCNLGGLAVGDEQVGKSRVAAEEREHPEAVPAPDTERDRAHEPAVPVGHVHRQLPSVAVVAPLLGEPGVKQERARTRPRPDQAVPLVGKPRKGGFARDRVERQLGGSGCRAHI
jgi:hypothetical protein